MTSSRRFAYAHTKYIDGGFPHTNVLPYLIAAVLRHTQPTFWLELGTFIGGSAIRTARAIKAANLSTTVVCVDPFTGGVVPWEREKRLSEEGQWRYLQLECGKPTVYDRFRANVVDAKVEDVMLPILAPSLVGMRLIERLVAQGRLPSGPQVR